MSTITATVTPPAADPRVVNEELGALAETLAAASEARRVALPAIEVPGVARRAAKLAAQLLAASRLIANGAHLEPPASIVALTRRAERAAVTPPADTGDVSMLDAAIEGWRATIVALHTWRGHTASVPAEEG